jgi:regulator of protease activity HflC (stomatin/prohibitin superfamily)
MQNVNAKTIGACLIALVVAVLCFGSFYTIDETERGVVLRNGAYVETVEPGLHWKRPIVDTVKEISVQSLTTTFDGLPVQTSDQQPANVKVSVSWHIDPGAVDMVYKRYTNLDNVVSRVVNRTIPTELKNTFGEFSAAKAISNANGPIASLTERMVKATAGVLIIDSVNIERVEFNGTYMKAISDKMIATEGVKTKEQLEKANEVENRIKVADANAKAAANLAVATAEATGIQLKGDAEALAIKAKGNALANNPGLVELIKAEQWNGQLPTTMLPNSTIPFLTK